MTSPAEAAAAIAEHIPSGTFERIPLAAATGRILAERVLAERDQPPFDRVTMDGIAIRYADLSAGLRHFAVAGTQAAGAPAAEIPANGQCIEIMTGAPLPAGADTVVPVERISTKSGTATLTADTTIEQGQFVHRRGSDRLHGDTLLSPGSMLGPAEIAVLASAGCAMVSVARKLNIAVISTGDELVGLSDPIEPYQIRSSNDYAIAAALERHGLATVSRHRLKDDADEILKVVRSLHETNDSLILSGGVSMGQFDFVPAVLDSLGCELVFHRINQKPGRPMWFGVSSAGKPIFALPGNPVSTLLCMARYVVPAFRKAAGSTHEAPAMIAIDREVQAPPDMSYFVPVILSSSSQGEIRATPRPTNTSGDFATLANTAGFLELPAGPSSHPAGTVGVLYRW
jgi:molybdopterin molybdotransferase